MPLGIGYARESVEETGERKECVRKSIQICLQTFRHSTSFTDEHADTPFGPSANGSGHVSDGGSTAASRENERRQRLDLPVHGIDPSLESFRLPGAGFVLYPSFRIGESRTNRKERLLDRHQSLLNIIGQRFTAQKPEQRHQLVNRAISFDANILFADPPT
jgi:hypothetical protein